MLTPAPATWIVRGATFALWALAAGSAAYWGLKLSGAPAPVSAPAAAPRQVPPADPVAIARLLGGSPAAAALSAPAPVTALSNRLQLVGVAAGVRSGGGAAVISVDGKPARSFRVGSTVDEGYVLQSVRGRQATIATQEDGRVVAVLELPPPRADLNRAVPALPPGMAPPAPITPAAPAAPVLPLAPPAQLAPPGTAPGAEAEEAPQAPSTAPR